ncbi:MAG: HepT-like ribonuclease domain-containing protein [Candidatus Bathyarchaeia archaeon]
MLRVRNCYDVLQYASYAFDSCLQVEGQLLLSHVDEYVLLVRMPVNTEHLKQRISEILEAKSELVRLTSKPFSKLSLEEKYAVRYQIIVLAEGLGSICVQVATEDFKLEPKSYSECFKLLEERRVHECAKDLTVITRLRNLLTHHYWTIDDKQVYESIRDDFKSVDEFTKNVKQRYAIVL